MADPLAQFANARYINLETFRKNGVGVRTPVWFAQDGNVFYVYSAPDAGKVKRIRNNPKVRAAPCDMRGHLRGAWVDGIARICDAAEAERGQQLLRQKYLLKRIGDFFTRMLGRKQVVIAIQIS
jgi:hypothetical protein